MNTEEKIKRTLFKRLMIIPIILSLIGILLMIPKVCDYFFVSRSAELDEMLLIILGIGAIVFMWIIYLFILMIIKASKKEKNWWVPLLIVILLIISPKLIYFISIIKMSLDNNPQTFTNVKPEIKAYEKLSEMPIYKDYKVLGEDLNDVDVYENIDQYKNTKVLVKGSPALYCNSDLYGNSAAACIENNKQRERIVYRFTFIDNTSEFANDNYVMFATKYTTPEDYYIYVYGKIVSTKKNTYKTIDIEPEKIYYTLKWDTMFIKEDAIVYSECAKVENRCSKEDLLKGQIVNVPVNKKTNLDFYVISDDGANLTLYGYQALSKEQYLSEDDTKKLLKQFNEKRYKYDNSNDYYMLNYWGPYTLMKELNELTKTWTNIPPIENYSYTIKKDNHFKKIEIQNGETTITSHKGNKTTVPGKSIARIINEDEIIKENEIVPRFYGMPCLRTAGIRDGATCESWVLDGEYSHEQWVTSISASYTNEEKYNIRGSSVNIHEKNYLVPVIEIPKSLINDK